MAIENYSTTAASNNATPPNGAPEGMAPSGVNDTIRQIMADLSAYLGQKGWRPTNHVGTLVSGGTFTVPGDFTGEYLQHRRIQTNDGTLLYGSIVSSSFASGNTTVNVKFDSGALVSNIPAGSILLGPDPVILQRILNVFYVDASVDGSSGDLVNNGRQYRKFLIANNTYNTAQGAGMAIELINSASSSQERKAYIAAYNGTLRFLPGYISETTNLDVAQMYHAAGVGYVEPGVTNGSDLGGASNSWRNLRVVNSPIVTSDPRLKDNITPISPELRRVLFDDVDGVTYTRKGGSAVKFGWNAAQVQEALIRAGLEEPWEEKAGEEEADRAARREARKRTTLVVQNDDPAQTLAMSYEGMAAVLWQEVRDLRARVTALENPPKPADKVERTPYVMTQRP